MQHDKRVGRIGSHGDKAVIERLCSAVDAHFEHVSMVGFQRGRVRRKSCPLICEIEAAKELVRFAFLIDRCRGHRAGPAPRQR